MFRWADHVDPDHVRQVRDAFDELAEQIDGLRHHAHGTDVGVSEGTYDYLVVADFESIEHWRAYRDHPAHVLLVEELIVGHVTERAGGQFQTHDDRSAHEVAARDRPALLAEQDPFGIEGAGESDEELLERARRVAMTERDGLLADPNAC